MPKTKGRSTAPNRKGGKQSSLAAMNMLPQLKKVDVAIGKQIGVPGSFWERANLEFA